MNYIVEKKRLDWIDALRALAIFLVILGHCAPNCYTYFLFTSPLKMPLFFVITGFVFNPINVNSAFYKKILVKIIFPWLILGLLPIAALVPIKGIGYLWHYALRMLSGESLWFMPCLFFAEIIWFYIRKIFSSTIIIIGVSLTATTFVMVMAHYNILDYGMINRAFVVQSFLAMGYVFKSNIKLVTQCKAHYLIILMLVYFCLIVFSYFMFPGQSIDVHNNSYYNIIICFALIAISCCMAFIIANRLKNIPRFISFLGQNTLLLYIWSPYVILSCHKMESMAGIENVSSFPVAIITSIITCAICCVVSIAVNRYVPFIVGKKYVKQN